MDIEKRLAEIKDFLAKGDSFCNPKAKEYLIELCRLCEELYAQASIDFLTGLYNRRFFEKELERSVERSKRERLVFSLILIDLDHFKHVNDRYGHLIGDGVLKKVGQLIKSSFRKIDIPARYGGEEFAVILPGTGFEGALSAAWRLKEKFIRENFGSPEKPIKITASMGVETYRPLSGLSAQEFLKKVDQLLYQAKESGRNKIVTAEPKTHDSTEFEGITYDERQALKEVWHHDD